MSAPIARVLQLHVEAPLEERDEVRGMLEWVQAMRQVFEVNRTQGDDDGISSVSLTVQERADPDVPKCGRHASGPSPRKLRSQCIAMPFPWAVVMFYEAWQQVRTALHAHLHDVDLFLNANKGVAMSRSSKKRWRKRLRDKTLPHRDRVQRALAHIDSLRTHVLHFTQDLRRKMLSEHARDDTQRTASQLIVHTESIMRRAGGGQWDALACFLWKRSGPLDREMARAWWRGMRRKFTFACCIPPVVTGAMLLVQVVTNAHIDDINKMVLCAIRERNNPIDRGFVRAVERANNLNHMPPPLWLILRTAPKAPSGAEDDQAQVRARTRQAWYDANVACL